MNTTQKQHAPQTPFDIAIVGSGAVGLTTAFMLAKRGFRLALLDRMPFNTITSAQHDSRAFAFAYGSKKILDEYALFAEVLAHAHPIKDIIVSSQDSSKTLSYKGAEVADHPMGYNVETWHYRQVLYRHLEAFPNVTLLDEHTLKDININQRAVSLSFENQNQAEIQASLLLACDGKNSTVRSLLGISHRTLPYHQTALVASMAYDLEDACEPSGLAFEHFTPTGPIALLPLGKAQDPHQARPHDSKGKCGIIWSLNDKALQDVKALSPQELEAKIASFFAHTYKGLQLLSTPVFYPIEGLMVKNIVQDRVVLVGDAAHAIHPVAGQGFNLGLRDGAVLAQILTDHKNLGLDIGSLPVLKGYEKARRSDHLSMTLMCHGLVRLFSNELKTLSFLRSFGLGIVDQIPPLKQQLTRHAMGLKA